MTKRTKKIDPFQAREAAKYEKPIPSREFILSLLKQTGRPLDYAALTKILDLETEEEEFALQRRIRAMLRDGQLERLKGGLLFPSGQRTLIKGKVQIEKGRVPKVWIIPADKSPRILLSAKDARRVYNGNHVVVSVLEFGDPPVRDGHLVEILEQQRLSITGRFVREAGINYVIPHGKEFTQNILIPPGKENGAQDGHIVVVEVSHLPHKLSDPLGQVTEVLGHEDAPGIEIKAATKAYGLPEVWPASVIEEVQAFKTDVYQTMPEAITANRLDLRKLPFVTIDGEDAKDFDDAVYCETQPQGGWRLYVAIADVSFYVKPDSALDSEAKLRGNSVYFPGKVIPMLPEVLSNELCSLKPKVDRLVMVCILHINPAGKITRYEFQEGVIRSQARLTYTIVAALLRNPDDPLAAEYQQILPHLQTLYKLYQVLRKEREERGAIEFETLETRIIFGGNGKISRIEPIQRNEAHKLIEECMLCANVATAKFLQKHKLPGLYRIHEGPSPDKLADLKVFLAELGLSLSGGKEPKSLDYAKLLQSVQNRSDANVIQTILLRSLSQAVYSPDNVGHFGLAYTEYCHFTSPIRRYPDLIVHRQIRSILRKEWSEKDFKQSKTKEFKEALLHLGDHTSMTERRADDATRDAVRWLKCEYVLKHVGDIFEGIISGVTRFGFFVELKDLFIDGLVHVNSLKEDYYYFDAVHHRLIGERSGKIFKLSDKVTVKVAKVDVHERKIDFELIAAEHQKPIGKPGRKFKRFGKNKTEHSRKRRHKDKGKKEKRDARSTAKIASSSRTRKKRKNKKT